MSKTSYSLVACREHDYDEIACFKTLKEAFKRLREIGHFSKLFQRYYDSQDRCMCIIKRKEINTKGERGIVIRAVLYI